MSATERHYFTDRRRALALWMHVLGIGDSDNAEIHIDGLHAVLEESLHAGRLPDLTVAAMSVALALCPSLRGDMARQVADELLCAAHDETGEAQANADGWDIDLGDDPRMDG